MISKHTIKKSNELEEATTRGGTKVKESAELTPGQLNSYATREGHSDIHFLKTKRVGYRDDGAKDVYLTLSLDNNEAYIVGKMLFYYSSDGDPVLEIEPAPVLVTSDRSEAINEFDNYNTSRSRESRRTRESTGRRYTLEYVLYYGGDVYRKVGSFTAPSDQEACKKTAMIQANYGPLKDLDAEARAELEEDVMRGFEEYPEQHSDPIEAWDSYITYNSEEFSARLTAPDGRVLVDTGMDDFAEEEDFEESRKASVDRLLREAAKPVQQDKLGAWYKQSFRESSEI